MWRVDDPRAALELSWLTTLQFLRESGLRCSGTHLHKEGARVIKNGKIYSAQGNTTTHLARLSVLIRLLLPPV
jgi:hypothetical protein